MRALTVALVTLSIAALAASAPLQAQRPSNRFLTFEDIDRARENGAIRTAYDVVQRLRPRWLQQREPLPATGATLVNPPVSVFVDDVLMGGVDFLSTIPVETILEMRWLSSNEAAGRSLRSDGLAAIVVTLKR